MKIDLTKYTTLSKSLVLSKIEPLKVFKYYYPELSLRNLILSPFREEKTPSFGIYLNSKLDEVRFKDFGGIGIEGDCISFVSILFKLSYDEALEKVNADINEISKVDVSATETSSSISDYVHKTKELSFIEREFNKYDLNYWSKFGIDLDILKKFDVRAAYKIVNGNGIRWRNEWRNPIYVYVFGERIKAYRPLEENRKAKWLSNARSTDIQGYRQLPDVGNLLILTKSMKDVMVLYRLGYNAISLQAESNYVPESIHKDIINRFSKIVILYDNDNTGKLRTNILTEKYGYGYIFIDEESGTKDIAEYVEKYGLDVARSYLEKLLEI